MNRIILLLIVFSFVSLNSMARQHWLVFYADKGKTAADVGHAFVSFKEAGSFQEEPKIVGTWGFYPDVKGLTWYDVVTVFPGIVKDDAKRPKDISFEVEVTKEEYDKCLEVKERWKGSQYQGTQRDCVDFIQEMIAHIPKLRSPSLPIDLPGIYLTELKALNCMFEVRYTKNYKPVNFKALQQEPMLKFTRLWQHYSDKLISVLGKYPAGTKFTILDHNRGAIYYCTADKPIRNPDEFMEHLTNTKISLPPAQFMKSFNAGYMENPGGNFVMRGELCIVGEKRGDYEVYDSKKVEDQQVKTYLQSLLVNSDAYKKNILISGNSVVTMVTADNQPAFIELFFPKMKVYYVNHATGYFIINDQVHAARPVGPLGLGELATPFSFNGRFYVQLGRGTGSSSAGVYEITPCGTDLEYKYLDPF